MSRILILTALQKELVAVLEALKSPFQEITQYENNGQVYFSFSYEHKEIICASMRSMGQVNAALATCNAVARFNIDTIILTGICGGISKSVKLGDVVISEQIVDYELSKVFEDHQEIRWNVYRSSDKILQKVKHFNNLSWMEYLRKMFPEKNINPTAHIGTVISGNKVIASESESARLTLAWRKALAIEMESAGIAAALYQMQNPPEFIMIKSVCDFADSYKADDWQEYSCYASAAYAISFLMRNSIESARTIKTPEDNSIGRKLRYILAESFSLNELKVLAFDMGIDFEDIPGDSKSIRVIELINYCKRRNKLNQLTTFVEKEREFVDFNLN